MQYTDMFRGKVLNESMTLLVLDKLFHDKVYHLESGQLFEVNIKLTHHFKAYFSHILKQLKIFNLEDVQGPYNLY